MGEKLRAEEKSQAAFGAVRAHAVDYVRLMLFEWPQQRGIILRIVFQVGILDQNIFPAGVLQRGANGRAFAVVLFVEDDGDVVGERHGPELLAGAVGGSVIDDDDLLLHWR